MQKLSAINSRYAINKAIKNAFLLFAQKDYQRAFSEFEKILALNPQNREAKIGLLLSDSALELPEHATHIFDYYQILLAKTTKQKAIAQVLEILESLDKATFFLSSMFKDAEQNKAEEMEGILYEDFLRALQKRESFKEAFEDLMFSTRIIFTNKREFYSFLRQLLENDFIDIGLEYIENLHDVYYDAELDKLLKKVFKKC